MLDGVSLDQLRALLAAADSGSFSAAARKLGRAQSAISELISNLERQIGVELFDRKGRYPVLTAAGLVIVADARSIVGSIDLLKARAKGLSSGLEAELSIVVDVFVPIDAVAATAAQFRSDFPHMPLRLYVEALGGVVRKVQDRVALLGIVGPQPYIDPSLVAERVGQIEYVMVAAREHPLAAAAGVLSSGELARHVQLVLTDRDPNTGRDIGILSPHVWRIADLFAKRAFILKGLGWGGMPRHTIQADIDEGRLVVLHVESLPQFGHFLSLSAIYRADTPPGPAGRWLIDALKNCG